MNNVFFAWAWVTAMTLILLCLAAFPLGIAWIDNGGIGFLVPNLGGYYLEI